MPKLRFQGKVLIFESNENDNIFEWDHRIFFTVAAGYKLDESHNRYLLADQRQLYGTLKETIGYLQDEGIEYETDESVAKLLRRFEAEQREYEDAVHTSLKIQEHVAQELANSVGLVRPLKPYQQQGLKHLLAVKYGANFSVPGSGKTTVIYAAFETLRREGIINKLLVIGPQSCFLPWEEEAIACFGHPLRGCRLTGSRMARQSLYLQSDAYDLFLCTYATAVNDLGELISLCKRYKVFMVIDESHNIKRLEGGVWSEAMLDIAPYATRRAILSGTPMPNDYTDLWTQITFLWPGKQVLGDRIPYRYRCEDSAELKSIRHAVRPFFFRATKAQLGLPPPKFNIEPCDLKPYQANIYRALAVKFLQEIDVRPTEREALRQWRKAKMVRLIQAASNPTLLAQYSEEFDVPPLSGEGASIIQLIDRYPQYETPAKIESAIQLVHDLLAQSEKVVVWTSFIHNIKMLEHLLQDFTPYVVYGAIPRDESEDVELNREQQIREFKEIDRPAILLANPAACAESISLHKVCHHAIYLDRTFNCGQYMQSLDRIHRIGLAPGETVTYHILVAGNTVDETIERRLKQKQENMLALLEGDFPTGTFEVEEHLMEQSEQQEVIDFEETFKDLRQYFSPSVVNHNG
jgi:SNF2 family DNA or RNA helicase